MLWSRKRSGSRVLVRWSGNRGSWHNIPWPLTRRRPRFSKLLSQPQILAMYMCAVYICGMPATTKRKTSLTLDSEALDSAKALGINVSAVAEEALINAVDTARRAQWLAENAGAFAAQSAWHEQHGHPLADILMTPGAASWRK